MSWRSSETRPTRACTHATNTHLLDNTRPSKTDRDSSICRKADVLSQEVCWEIPEDGAFGGKLLMGPVRSPRAAPPYAHVHNPRGDAPRLGTLTAQLGRATRLARWLGAAGTALRWAGQGSSGPATNTRRPTLLSAAGVGGGWMMLPAGGRCVPAEMFLGDAPPSLPGSRAVEQRQGTEMNGWPGPGTRPHGPKQVESRAPASPEGRV